MNPNCIQKIREYVVATNKELSDNSCSIHPHDGCCIYCRGAVEKAYCDEVYEDNQERITHKTTLLVNLLRLYRKLSTEEKKLLKGCITCQLSSDLSSIDKIKGVKL